MSLNRKRPSIIVRNATVDDSELLLRFISQLDHQSEYLLYEPGERGNSLQRVKEYLKEIENNKKSIVLLALDASNEIVGYLCGEVSNLKRIAHVMKINIGIVKSFRGTTVSRKLSQAILDHVKSVDIKRVEATVIANNKVSLNLCKKFGFEIEGIKRKSIRIANIYYDEYYLSKIFA